MSKKAEREKEITEAFVELRHRTRDLLGQHNIFSNPGWTEENIVDALRKLLKVPPLAGLEPANVD